MSNDLRDEIVEMLEKGLNDHRSTGIGWKSFIGLSFILMTALFSLNSYMIKAWVERVETHGVESNKQMQAIVQDIKSIELKLTVLNSTLVDRTEVRRMIQEAIDPKIQEAIRVHEKEFHLK